MSYSVSVLPPSSCDEHTDLTPFVESLITRAKSHHQSHFLSVTIETDYSDPLAILEEIHQVDTPICYLEKPANEFSIAAGDYLTVARFSGVNRFHEARAWADLTLNNTVVAGDHKIPGTGPTLFLTATFENDSVNPDNPPPLKSSCQDGKWLEKKASTFLH